MKKLMLLNFIFIVSTYAFTQTNILTDADIQDLPVNNLVEILMTIPGITYAYGEIYLLGTHSDNLLFLLDGEEIDKTTALKLSIKSVKKVEIIAEEITAEYGDFHSGIIKITTKSGTERYTANLKLGSDHIAADANMNSDNLNLSIGGPLLPFATKKLKLFANYSGNYNDTRLKDYYEPDFNYLIQNEYLDSSWGNYIAYDSTTRSMFFNGFDERNYNLMSILMKLSYDISERQGISITSVLNNEITHPYAHSWKYALEHYAETEDNEMLLFGIYENQLTQKMKIDVQTNFYHKSYLHGPKDIDIDSYFSKSKSLFEDPNDGFDLYFLDDMSGLNTSAIYEHRPNGVIGDAWDNNLPWSYISSSGSAEQVPFVYPGTIYGSNIDDKKDIFTTATNFEYNINNFFNIKTGLKFQKYNIRKNQMSNPWNIDEFRYNEFLKTCTPQEAHSAGDTLWIVDFNDQGELWEEGDGVQISLPWHEGDAGDPSVYLVLIDSTDFYSQEDLYAATLAASGTTDGYEASPTKVSWYLQNNMVWKGTRINAGLRFDKWNIPNKHKILTDGGMYTLYESIKPPEVFISPRINASQQITNSTKLFLTINWQNQLPNMEQIYTTTSPADAIFGIFNEPNLEPEKTEIYSIGIQQKFLDYFTANLTGYFRNEQDHIYWIEVYSQGDPPISWYELRREEVENKGFNASLHKALSHYFSGSLSYSYDDEMESNFLFNVLFKVEDEEVFYIPFVNIPFFDNFSVNFMYNTSTGKSYTPQNEEGSSLDTNSASQPDISNAKLKIQKEFRPFGRARLGLFIEFDNLFDKTNVLSVYPKTGLPDDDGTDLWEDNDPNQYVDQKEGFWHDQLVNDPTMISKGQTIIFGFEYSW